MESIFGKSRMDDPHEPLEETLRRHREILKKFAVEHNIPIAEKDIYEEVVSGDSLYARPQMLRLLEDVAAGKFDGILCMDIQRLGRGSMSDQGIILRRSNHPVQRSSRRSKHTISMTRATRHTRNSRRSWAVRNSK